MSHIKIDIKKKRTARDKVRHFIMLKALINQGKTEKSKIFDWKFNPSLPDRISRQKPEGV